MRRGTMIMGTVTGRFSKSTPEPQDLRHESREYLDGLVNTDFSLIELMVLGHFPSEEWDVHRARAAHHFGVTYDQVTDEQRRIGKQLNYINTYGVER